MTKKALIFITCATVFSMGVAMVTLSGIQQVERIKTGATDTRVVEFYNQGDNLTYDGENHIALYEGNLSDGTPLYMRVSAVSDMGAENSYFVAGLNTTIYFYEESTCENEYRFQNTTSFAVYHEATEKQIPVEIWATDGIDSDISYLQLINDGVATSTQFSSTGVRQTRFTFTGSNTVAINKVSISYTCSYDWVEPNYKTVDIYASNDFHGAIEQDKDNPGLEYWGSYYKYMGQQENTLLLDQGDTWQGSIYSNINHGNLINDVMCEARWDARTVGNHDFDWGVNPVKENASRSYGGYTVPALAANVYDYNFSTKEFGTTQQSDFGSEYITYTLENGLKVGVIGVIGEDQITSINSLYTTEIGFKPHIPIIKSLATELRNNQHCDIVICSIHAGEEDVMGNGLKDYVDLVLCAHTHRSQENHEGNLYYAQFYKEGRQAGHIRLTYDTNSGKVVKTNIDRISRYGIINYVDSHGGVDTTIHNLVAAAKSAADAEANVVVASNVIGDFASDNQLPNLMAKAIFDQADDAGYDIDISYVNFARANITKAVWTYADIYRAFPFDNTVYIITCTGKEFINEVTNYNYAYIDPNFNRQIDLESTYTIACLDYLAFHTDTNRDYDYFPSIGNQSPEALSKNYREILRDWLISEGYNTGTELNANSYLSSLEVFNRTFTITTEYTATFMYNYNDAPNSGVYATVDMVYKSVVADHLPVDPTRDGYTFGGWYRDAGCTKALGGWYLDRDMTFYAKWTSNEEPPAKGTVANNPFTVSEAIAHIDSVINEGTYLDGNDGNTYYVSGTITGEVSKSGYADAYRFVITDGVSSFTAYYASWAGDAPVEGDIVVLEGQIMYYSSGSIYETKSGTGAVVSVTKPKGTVANNPFTILEAIDHINSVGNDGNYYYVTGTVVADSIVQSIWEGQENNYKFVITDGLDHEFTAYYVDCSTAGAPEAGDIVVIRGQFTLYNETIYETVSGTGTLISRNE